MKVFLLVVTILLLISRIKSTPKMLSKTIYRAKTIEALDKQKKTFESYEGNVEELKGGAILAIILIEIFFAIYYLVVGNRFSNDTTMLVLSALQIVTVFVNLKKNLNKDIIFSQNVEDYKFYRFIFLFNVVLDYVYYPMTIYMLLNN